MTVPDAEIRKKGAINGVLLGVIVMVLSIISYYLSVGIANPWVSSIGTLVISGLGLIVAAVLFCADLRKKIGGFWTFKQAVSGLFVMFLVSYVINYLGTNVLFAKVIEPQMTERVQEKAKLVAAQIMEKQSVSQEVIDDKIEEMQKGFDKQKENSTKTLIMSFGVTLLLLFIASLIFAAMFKKEPPLYDIRSVDEGDLTV